MFIRVTLNGVQEQVSLAEVRVTPELVAAVDNEVKQAASAHGWPGNWRLGWAVTFYQEPDPEVRRLLLAVLRHREPGTAAVEFGMLKGDIVARFVRFGGRGLAERFPKPAAEVVTMSAPRPEAVAPAPRPMAPPRPSRPAVAAPKAKPAPAEQAPAPAPAAPQAAAAEQPEAAPPAAVETPKPARRGRKPKTPPAEPATAEAAPAEQPQEQRAAQEGEAPAEQDAEAPAKPKGRRKTLKLSEQSSTELDREVRADVETVRGGYVKWWR